MKYFLKIAGGLGPAVLFILAGCSGPETRVDVSRHRLAILATTDEHQYLLPYNYLADAPDDEIGLSQVFTLVEAAREEYPHTLLFSAGDVIQGSLVGEIEAKVDPLEGDEYQAIIRAFNHMGYDAVAVGNHDLTDFGIDFFLRARRNSEFPWLAANIRPAGEPEGHFVKPYTVLERELDGIPIRIGVIGLAPPQIADWGRRHLQGEVVVEDILHRAEEYIPRLREKSDLVVVLAHSGIDPAEPGSDAARENAGYWLAQIDGVDALVLGHQHRRFPGDFPEIPGIENQRGLIHGVPAVLPASWGRALGVIELELARRDGRWSVTGGSSHLRDSAGAGSHPEIEEIAGPVHRQTLEYVRTPLGRTAIPIASYFSRIVDSPLTQLINDAQLAHGRQLLADTPHRDLPLLSASAPFVAGREGPGYFTSVSGEINIGDVTDIYIYPNTIEILKLNGEELRDYLEHSALNFNRIDPGRTDPQDLVDYGWRAFNFDVVEGVEYRIDVTREAGNRIEGLAYRGEPVTGEMEFLIVLNNYRGGGGGDFPHMTPENLVLSTTDISREAVIDYIRRKGEVNPAASGNWSIRPVETAGPVLYRSSPDGRSYLEENPVPGIEYRETDPEGWGVYRVDLSVF